MKILISDPNDTRRRKASKKLATLPGVDPIGICADLTSTFNEVEHRPPTLVLVAPEFTLLPEFETMLFLFRSLKVSWLTYSVDRVSPSPTRKSDHTHILLDHSSDAQTILNTLRAAHTRTAPPLSRAGAGLFRSTSTTASNELILIGSSTGGIDALLKVLGSFPSDCPATLIVQHTGAGFSAGLARLLNRNVEPLVTEASEGEIPSRGKVLVAPGSETHLKLKLGQELRCSLENDPKISGHRPSIDALFQSAVPVAKRVSAAILTGMGRDGAHGLLELRNAGAKTLGQDERTSVVYGMPKHAAELGATERTLPLPAIGPALLRSSTRTKV